ncbi:MAG: tRNA uridine-5-carboxymethylaminomethyl(34) synthesis GTPase MnmE [Bacteroidales bacterium]|jgi:tRNA modification GTPase|nr:tRNA uridine-5-carboxymethylaminomethyl(34) synthesis GTPase MnmE [Bacteroidales bacterium]
MLTDTICAISTPYGTGAVAMIRISGKNALYCLEKCFHLGQQKLIPRTVYLKTFYAQSTPIDTVLLTYFAQPQSFTGENMIEISSHGSVYIQQQIIMALLAAGCRMATEGEFTQRAFLNGKMDLLQAEAVADLIAADSADSHRLAMNNLRGDFSLIIKELKEKLLNFASLLELELDFGEEDVEFANRQQMNELLSHLSHTIETLLQSFALGTAIKNGVPIAIVGEPNSGKSTLLNALLKDNRAIVSPIPGTTRDTIEDSIVINGCNFRFIDTAGIRSAKNEIEKIGIERTFDAVKRAFIVLYVVDIEEFNEKNIILKINELIKKTNISDAKILLVVNKMDMLPHTSISSQCFDYELITISAKNGDNLDILIEKISKIVDNKSIKSNFLLTNLRHYQILQQANSHIANVQQAMSQQMPSDMVASDIRQVLNCLADLIGEITTADILTSIFSRFCIGK